MKTGSTALILACALLLAGAAHAQPAAAPQPAAPPSAAAPAPAAPGPAAGTTVSGLTVEGNRLPQKSCSSRDKDCIATVTAELKARYPKELQRWCALVAYRAANTNMIMDQVNGIGTAASPGQTSVYGRFAPPAVAKVACAADKPKEKSQ